MKTRKRKRLTLFSRIFKNKKSRRPKSIKRQTHKKRPTLKSLFQPVSDSSSAIVPVATPPPVLASNGDLTTQDLLRPNDKLKSSMEGFFLDQRSEHTRRAYGKDYKRFIHFLHGRVHDKGPEPLTRHVVAGYKDYLLSEKLQHTSVDRHLATLKSIFRWMVEDGILSKNPAENIRFLNPKKISPTNAFTDEEVRKVLSLPNLHRRTGAMHYAILTILFFCGLRRSEVCELKTSHLGEERGFKTLRLRGKGNKERILPLVPIVADAISHYLLITQKRLDRDEYLFTPVRNNRTGNTEKPIDSSMIYYIVKKYAQQAGVLNRVSPHSCRATAISNARDHDVADRAIQEYAGWASTDMITRYDKRKTALEKSAAHAIQYGVHSRLKRA